MAQVKCLFAFSTIVPQGSACGWHEHPCAELVYTGRSAGWYFEGGGSGEGTKGSRVPFQPGQIFTYQPGPRHRVEVTTAGEHWCIGVRGCGAEQIPPTVLDSSETLTTAFHRCLESTRTAGPLRQEWLYLQAGLIVLEIRSALQLAAAPPPADYAQQARALIEARFNERLSLRDIASDLYISPDYLRQLFRQRFGQSPIHYLIRKRIEAAQIMLRTSTLSIREIGGHCGFENPYYFSRMFHKVTGQSASDFRGTRNHHS
ncbi:MAG: AraC family transcriptional regulator [Phycisphaerae bacterium]